MSFRSHSHKLNNKIQIRSNGLAKVLTLLLTAALLVDQGTVYASTTVLQRTNLKSNLFAEGVITESMAKDTHTGRAITRAEFAEAIVRLQLKLTKSTVSALRPQGLVSDSKEPFVNVAYDFNLMSIDGKKRFNPKGTLTREQAAVILDKMLRSSVLYGSIYKKAVAKAPVISDAKNVSSNALKQVKAIAASGIMPLKASKFNPKANMTVLETLQAMDGVLSLLKVRSAESDTVGTTSYPTSIMGRFTAPAAQFTDLMVFVPSSGSADLSMNFTGVFSSKTTKSPKDLHLQVITTILSSGAFTDADGVETLKAIESGWDGTARTYHFDKDLYIKSGRVQEIKPNSMPYIKIKAGEILNIDVHITK